MQTFFQYHIFNSYNLAPPNFAFALTITRFKFITGDRSGNINENWKNYTTCKGKERILGDCACRGKVMLTQVDSCFIPDHFLIFTMFYRGCAWPFDTFAFLG